MRTWRWVQAFFYHSTPTPGQNHRFDGGDDRITTSQFSSTLPFRSASSLKPPLAGCGSLCAICCRVKYLLSLEMPARELQHRRTPAGAARKPASRILPVPRLRPNGSSTCWNRGTDPTAYERWSLPQRPRPVDRATAQGFELPRGPGAFIASPERCRHSTDQPGTAKQGTRQLAASEPIVAFVPGPLGLLWSGPARSGQRPGLIPRTWWASGHSPGWNLVRVMACRECGRLWLRPACCLLVFVLNPSSTALYAGLCGAWVLPSARLGR